ncbi:MAG TPA: Os1348 family NHLP clan protein [Methylomirabilota bacterium]|nr:Os1348 family NHLP clan protein [Methylomirabilota bacterium]
MSHRSVESIIGKLATDEGFRRRFLDNPADVLDELRGQGCELSSVEVGALSALDQAAITAFAEALDRRLQKVDLQSHRNAEGIESANG